MVFFCVKKKRCPILIYSSSKVSRELLGMCGSRELPRSGAACKSTWGWIQKSTLWHVHGHYIKSVRLLDGEGITFADMGLTWPHVVPLRWRVNPALIIKDSEKYFLPPVMPTPESVLWFICKQDYTKTTEQISTKLCGGMGPIIFWYGSSFFNIETELILPIFME